MKNKRFLSSLATVLCSLFLLSSCSGTGSGSQTGSSNSSSSGQQEAPAELTIGFYINSSMPTDMDLVIEEINKILLEKASGRAAGTSPARPI